MDWTLEVVILPVSDGHPGEITTRIRDQYWALHNDHRYTTIIDSPATAAASSTG
jgi:hypothetical protein